MLNPVILGVLAGGKAAASPLPLLWLALLAAAVWMGWYVLACWVWPWRDHRRCKGTGRRPALWGGRAWRTCRRCDGTGKRLRLGRRIVNWWTRTKAEAVR